MKMKHLNPKMLLHIAMADAYGMAREYVKTSEFPEHVAEVLKFEKYHKHPSYHKLAPGMYTDDTQMSIAITEVLLSDGPRAKNAAYAKAFCALKISGPTPHLSLNTLSAHVGNKAILIL